MSSNSEPARELRVLLQNLSPVLNTGQYVFCRAGESFDCADEVKLGSFRESEGLSLILERAEAERLNLEYSTVMSWITLGVDSSLEAIGLTARVSSALADNGVACNFVAAFSHDHIFVCYSDAAKAIEILDDLSGSV